MIKVTLMMGVRYDSNKERKIEVGKKICDLYHTRKYTIQTCCDLMEVPYHTFYQWVQFNVTDEQIASKQYLRGFVQEVHYYYIKGFIIPEPDFTLLLKNKVRESFLKRMSGYMETTTQTKQIFDKDGNQKHIIITTSQQFIMPSPHALIFILENIDSFAS
jgi:hypothetical protein